MELIIRTSLIKYGNVNELNRSIEKLLEKNIVPMIEKNNGKRPKSQNSEKSNHMLERRDWEG